MKTIILCGCLLSLSSMVLAGKMTQDEIKAIAKKLLEECKTKSGAGDADIANLRDKKMPETEEGLCMLECVFETSGIMKDGKYTKEGMIKAFAPVAAHDEAKLNNLKNLAETCEKEIGEGDPDKCQNAKIVVHCIHTHAPKHDFELPEID